MHFSSSSSSSSSLVLVRRKFLLVMISFGVLFCQPCSPTRLFPDPLFPDAFQNDVRNATWRDFSKFLDAGMGSRVVGMSELKKYFNQFGYLPSMDSDNWTDDFDSEFKSAVIMYQKRLGLSVTGRLDSDTMSTMMSPRCGVSDDSHPGRDVHTTRRYAYFNGKPRWDRSSPSTLTYTFSHDHMIDYLNTIDVKAAFKRAFSRWAAVIPVNFEEVHELKGADIHIGFYHGNHGDGEAFDGVLGVLAHAFSPENGRFHLDAAETWAVDFKKEKSKVAVDLESVATHEIGHVLGLAHSSVKEAVMYPSLSPRTRKVDLRIDDVEGAQALYGSNPNFKLDNFLQSENSSGNSIGTSPSRLSILTVAFIFVFVHFMDASLQDSYHPIITFI